MHSTGSGGCVEYTAPKLLLSDKIAIIDYFESILSGTPVALLLRRRKRVKLFVPFFPRRIFFAADREKLYMVPCLQPNRWIGTGIEQSDRGAADDLPTAGAAKSVNACLKTRYPNTAGGDLDRPRLRS
jgi:hypothetical protein